MARTLLLAFVVNALCLAAALLMDAYYDIKPSALYRDPAAVVEAKFAIGWFSNLGAVLMFATATACLFTACLLYGAETRPLLVFGALTLMLAVDDLFMIHDGILPFLGVPGTVLYAVYAFTALFWLVGYRAEVMRTRWTIFVAAVAFLGFSAVSDTIIDAMSWHGEPAYLVEDISKLMGIVFWASYGLTCAWSTARRHIDRLAGRESMAVLAPVASPVARRAPARVA